MAVPTPRIDGAPRRPWVTRVTRRAAPPATPPAPTVDRRWAIADEFVPSENPLLVGDALPLRWWTYRTNFGDLLSPWLAQKMTGRKVVLAEEEVPHYVAVGSVLKKVVPTSVVWGSGSFGTENREEFCTQASYTAVRGPLSRARLLDVGGEVPRVYGDPALLTPLYFREQVPVTHEVGIVARWSEKRWARQQPVEGVRHIDLGSADVEGTLREILSCRRIVTGSLHGLIVADAFGIPSAWVLSRTATGGEFKFFDYFATVDKFRRPQFKRRLGPEPTVEEIVSRLRFDDRPISFKYRALLRACPFMEHRPRR